MAATLKVTTRPERYERREVVTLPDGSDFTIILRQPSFEFAVKDLSGGGWEQRFQAIVVGWEGVNVEDDKGEEAPLGYSFDNFKRVCENYPSVFNQVSTLIFNLINELPPAKNSEPPSGESSSPDGGTESTSETETTS